ncbi:hypothetical protein [Haladaptatus sp. DYF46]|nr:hypothetical protein [Haladaptatus sp. DYF46]
MSRNFPITQSSNHHVVRLGNVLRVLKHIEILVFDLLTLGTFLAEGD